MSHRSSHPFASLAAAVCLLGLVNGCSDPVMGTAKSFPPKATACSAGDGKVAVCTNWTCEQRTGQGEFGAIVVCTATQPPGAPVPLGKYHCPSTNGALFCPPDGDSGTAIDCTVTPHSITCQTPPSDPAPAPEATGTGGSAGGDGSGGSPNNDGSGGSPNNDGSGGSPNSDGSGGSAGSGGGGGSAGTDGSGGSAGTDGSGGSAGTDGSGGSAGTGGGGSAGTDGSGGSAGNDGSGGSAGTDGSGGSAGNDGSGGSAGTGSGGSAGNDGSGGSAGNDGSGGSAGNDGSGGSAGTADCNCTRTQGYWKNHAEVWPVASLVVGQATYPKDELLVLFMTEPMGDASLILGHQLFAALLNQAADAAVPAPIAQALSDAQQWMQNHKDGDNRLPYGVSPSSPEGSAAVALSAVLDEFNRGLAGTPHCQ